MALIFLLFFFLHVVHAEKPCKCNSDGTIGSLLSCTYESSCFCKPSVIKNTGCEYCYPQFYNLSSINVFGCQRCSCDLGGSLSRICDLVTGQCDCKPGITGKDCDRPSTGSFIPAMYHIKSNLVVKDSISGLKVDNAAKISGIIEPREMSDVPPRFKLLFTEYPIPIPYDDFFEKSTESTDKGLLSDSPSSRLSMIESRPIVERSAAHSKRQATRVTFTADLEFPRPGTYFLIMNYTSSTESVVHVYLSDEMMPTVLPACSKCLIMLAGTLGVKGIEVESPGKQQMRIEASSYFTQIFNVVALPKQYYFTTSLKSDVSPRCDPGPFTQLCNKYKYPLVSRDHIVEEAESWLSPVTQPAYTQLAGVNLFGTQNLVKSTNKLKISTKLERGVTYHVVVSYYKPYHYTNHVEPLTALVTWSSGRQSVEGVVEMISCPWEEGCRVAVTTPSSRTAATFVVTTQRTVTLTLTLEREDADSMVFLDSVMFIKESDWNLDLIQAQWHCVIGPDNTCLQSEFIDLTDHVFYESESSIDAVKVEIPNTFHHGTGVMLLDQDEPSLSVVLIENIIRSPVAEDYVIIVHYFKYTDDTTKGQVTVQDENGSQADLDFSFCPSASGCRVAGTLPGRVESGVVSHNPSWTGYWTPLPVTGGDTVIIVSVSITQPDSVYVDFLALVPVRDFTPDMLYPLPLDHGPIFSQYCAYHYLYLNPAPHMKEYCDKVVFTMATLFNDGALDCDCSETGAVSDTCDPVSGRCQCETGYTGRACDQCELGYHGYPNCTECSCDPDKSYSDMCDSVTGQCQCIGSYGGRDCDGCGAGFYGNTSCDIPCDCDVQGTVGISCHPSTGQCRCRDNTDGRQCDSCSPSYYRFPACYPCHCNTAGSHGNECDEQGSCHCKDGYTGSRCDECLPTWYSNGTGECVPCDCSGLHTTCTALHTHHTVSELIAEMEGRDAEGGLIQLPTNIHGDNMQLLYLTYPTHIVPHYHLTTQIQATLVQGSNGAFLSYRTELDPQSDLVTVLLNTTLDWFIVTPDTMEVPVTTHQMEQILGNISGIWIPGSVDNIKPRQSRVELHYVSTRSVCDCGVGYSGDRCQNCSAPYHRSSDGKCDRKCDCHGNSDTCTDTGICIDCGNHSDGDYCERCESGYYLNTTSSTCELCPCSANGRSTSDQECMAVEEDTRVICTKCAPGYTGPACATCDNGYHGDPYSDRGCEKCPCYNNLNLTVPNACDPVTARCNVCVDGVVGQFCDECSDGYYGDARASTCNPCECNESGSKSSSCDEQGKCSCRGDISGDKCDSCPAGWYISPTEGWCMPCECQFTTSTSGVCNATTGNCDCVPGYSGHTCSECSDGYYPYYDTCLDCNCSERGSYNESCDTNRVCHCKPGYHGDQCDQCSGYFTTDEAGSCTVCDGCPVLLLDRIAGINTTLDTTRTNAQTQDNMDRIDKLMDRADKIRDKIPEIVVPELSNYTTTAPTDPPVREMEEGVRRVEEGVDALADDVQSLDNDLRDVISALERISPDTEESGAQLDTIQDIIREMERRNPIKPARLLGAHAAALKANESVASLPTPLTPLPDLTPLFNRTRESQDQIKEKEEELEELGKSLEELDDEVDTVEDDEEGAIQLGEEITNKTLQIESRIPGIRDDINATHDSLDDIELPDLVPLQNLVEEQEAALRRLSPISPRQFNCSELQFFTNISHNDTGPLFIRQTKELEESVEDLRGVITTLDMDNALVQLDELSDDIDDRNATQLDIKPEELNPKIGDLEAEEAAQRPAVEDTGVENGMDRDRLATVQIPRVPLWTVGEVPDPVVEVIDTQPLQDRIDSIKPEGDMYQVDDALPILINKTEQAERDRDVLIVEFKSIDYKLRSLRDKIERAKRSAESILIPMQFTGDDSFASYPAEVAMSGYLSLKVSVQPDADNATGGIVQLGETGDRVKRETGNNQDLVELSLDEGRVVCNVNIDQATATLVNDKISLEKDIWSSIHLQRKGDSVSLTVEDTEVTAPLDTTSSLSASRIVIGKTSAGSIRGSITDVYLNGDRLSQWLSESSAGVNKSVWANRVISADKNIYYLNGDTSYLAFKTVKSSRYLRTVSVEIKTVSDNGLIMFYGEGSEAAGSTADVFAMDLYNGNVRLHYTDSGGELHTLVKETETDREFSEISFQDISAYVQQQRAADSSKTSLRTPTGEMKGVVPGVLMLEDYSAPEVTYFGKVPDSVLARYPRIFGEEGGISRIPFTGCMKPYRLNNEVLRQQFIDTARDVTNGCPDKILTTVTLKEGGMVKMAATDIGNVSFSIATNTLDTVTLLYLGDSEAAKYLRVSLEDGVLIATLDFEGVISVSLSSSRSITGGRRYIRLELTDRLSLYVDDVLTDTAPVDSAILEALKSFPTSPLYLGNVPKPLATALQLAVSPSYTGCISNVIVKSRIQDFQYGAVEKNNVILDRCRTIRSPAAPVTEEPVTLPPTLPATLSPDNLHSGEEESCTGFHSNPVPNSFHLSSTSDSTSFLKIPLSPQDISMRMVVSLQVTTLSPSGILVYTENVAGKRISVEFDSEGVHLVTDLAADRVSRISNPVLVNDGYPHTVTMERSMFNFKLRVDDQVQPGTVLGAQLFQLDSADTLESCSNGVCIGGETHTPTPGQFVGCVSNITLNSVKYDDSNLVFIGDHVSSPCPAMQASATLHYFTPSSTVVPDAKLSPTDKIVIRFRSSGKSGVIATLIDDTSDSNVMALSIQSGQVMMTVDNDVTIPHEVSDSANYFCQSADNHSLSIQLLGNRVIVKVDEDKGEAVAREMAVDIYLPVVMSLKLGGGQFAGCMEAPLINGAPLSLTSPLQMSGVLLNSCPGLAA